MGATVSDAMVGGIDCGRAVVGANDDDGTGGRVSGVGRRVGAAVGDDGTIGVG